MRTRAPGRPRPAFLLGPAFVAAVAYVDPGNVAANITAGARHGHLLVWVLVAASVMAVLVQYQSAKLGIVTGRSLPAVLGERLPTGRRRAYWAQAELVAAATDVAEVIGGAIALNLLFGVPLLLGGVITGVVSIALLQLQSRDAAWRFELVVAAFLAIITLGFLAGLVVAPPDPGATLGGLVPRFDGTDSVLVAAGMLGATVMPHAVYLHSSLVVDRFGSSADPSRTPRLLRATRIDVVGALAVAGTVNICLLLLAATALPGREGTDTIEGAHAAITDGLGPVVGVVFAVGLLASGLASTSVGCYAGSEIMAGLLRVRVPVLLRRSVTLVPALVLLALGGEPTMLLVLSQVVLSFGIAFAVIPLRRLTGDAALMGEHRDGPALRAASGVSVALIVALNVALLWLTFTGAG